MRLGADNLNERVRIIILTAQESPVNNYERTDVWRVSQINLSCVLQYERLYINYKKKATLSSAPHNPTKTPKRITPPSLSL